MTLYESIVLQNLVKTSMMSIPFVWRTTMKSSLQIWENKVPITVLMTMMKTGLSLLEKLTAVVPGSYLCCRSLLQLPPTCDVYKYYDSIWWWRWWLWWCKMSSTIPYSREWVQNESIEYNVQSSLYYDCPLFVLIWGVCLCAVIVIPWLSIIRSNLRCVLLCSHRYTMTVYFPYYFVWISRLG